MEALLYGVISCSSQPPDDLIDALTSIGEELFKKEASDETHSVSLPGDIRIEKFLRHGANVNLENVISEGARTKPPISSGPRVVRLVRRQSGRLHPQADRAISLLRVWRADLECDMIKLSINGKELKERLRNDQIFWVLGKVDGVDLEAIGNALLVWQGFAARPAGMASLLKDTHDFTTPARWDK